MNSFPTVALGEVITLERRPVVVAPESEYAEIGIYCFGRGIFHKPPRSGVEVGNKDLFLIKEGDFILQVTFAWEGAVALASASEEGMYGSTRYPTFRVKEEICFPPYLVNYFKTPQGREQLIKISPGSAGRNRVLSMKRLPHISIPLPPLIEQQRIVARIEDLSAKIAEAQALRQEVTGDTERLFQASMDYAVERLARKHESKQLDDLVDSTRGISYGVVLTGEPHREGVPTLRAGDLQRFKVLLGNVKRVSPEIEAKYKRTRLQGNELLLRIRGGLGEVAMCPPEMIGGNVSREIAVIPLRPEMLPEYVMYVLSAPRSQVRMINKVRGIAHVGINLKDVRKLPIPIPPYAEQVALVKYLENSRAQIASLNKLQSQTATELDAMLPAILDKAFKGELLL